MMKTNLSTNRKRPNLVAFTLIEIVLVLAIIALLLGAVYQLTGVYETGQGSRVRTDLETFRTALTIYRANSSTYPTTEQGLKALVEKPETGPVSSNYRASLDAEVLDPWGNVCLPYPPTHNARHLVVR